MRIAILSPVWFPVPPAGYGGIEWIISLLADGLAAAGHDVTLFASGDSFSKATLASVFEEAPSAEIGKSGPELRHALACYERAEEFDIVNDHSGPLAAAVGGAVATPVVHTVHGPLTGRDGELYASLARVAPDVGLISVSLNQRKPQPDLPWVATCHNALDLDAYPVHSERGEYLLFLGRMSADKGCHRAVEVARQAGVPLRIAGKMREPAEREYFEEFVAPHLGDGIDYLGETSHGKKVALLQNARATLFPIDWEEPFGLVMIESMACGTPVIATRWGAVPEVIEHGRYSEIYVFLEKQGGTQTAIEEIFSPATPIVLPTFVPNLFAPERANGATGYVDVEFDITQFGTTRRIRVLDTHNASKAAGQRISRWIVESRFRPRMADGKLAEASRVVARHYVHE